MSESLRSATKIVPQKLSDQVFLKLREMVATGELSPGDLVPSERELMEKFGVGRPAVREALQAMQAKGLITINHGERSRVNALNAGVAFKQLDDVAKLLLSSEPANIDHLKQIRQILEVGTIKIAAPKCTAEDVADLENLIEAQRQQLGDAKAFMQADIAFHTRLSIISGNPLIQAITEMMLTWLFEYHSSLLLWSGREETTLKEHALILGHLKEHDAYGASLAMNNHLNRSSSSFVRTVD
ncbi:MAG: transcriptional regulator NanR [Gammaproteobacteria bacterium]|nr:transcriptional regulator NanR [Gammaproteobacteria bacterium]